MLPLPDSSPPTISTMPSVEQRHHPAKKRSAGTTTTTTTAANGHRSHCVPPVAFQYSARTAQRRIPSSASTTTTTTTTVPNGSSGGVVDDRRSSMTLSSTAPTTAIHAPRDDERQPQPRTTSDVLNDIPSDYDPSYPPLPLPLKMAIVATSLLAATHRRRSPLPHPSTPFRLLRRAVAILFRFTLLALLSTITIQDLFYPPSRLPLSTMHSRRILPSPLSVIANVTLPSATLAVHHVRHVSHHPSPLYDALYVNHGFGASSLSFLPSLPPLVRRLRCRVGVGHDTVGFGLTERPEDPECYSSVGSAMVGGALLRREWDGRGTTTGRTRRACVLGHSLGSVATLRMALDLVGREDVEGVDVVLVAPALRGSVGEWKRFLTREATGEGVAATEEERGVVERVVGGLTMPFYRTWRVLRYLLFDVPFCYLLRRLVSPASFWKNGLSSAWYDPSRLSPDTILAYRWPSLSRGWERGILSFVRAQLNKRYNYPHGGDWGLLRRVLSSEKVRRAVIVHGREDRIVPVSMSETLRRCLGIEVRVMDGVGHNPFEEDVERFVDVVEECLLGGEEE